MNKFVLSFLIQCSVVLAYVPVVPVELEVKNDDFGKDLREIHGATMGIAEIVVQIKNEVHNVHRDVNLLQDNLKSRKLRSVSVSEEIFEMDIEKRMELADKVEKMLAVQNNPHVDQAKVELKERLQLNFVKMLSAILVTEPVQIKGKSGDILKLMKSVLNEEVDFDKIVAKLPFLLRDHETNQFVVLLNALKETERTYQSRQFGGLQNVDKIVDILGTVDLKEVAGFLKQIPELFESVESIVDGADEYF